MNIKRISVFAVTVFVLAAAFGAVFVSTANAAALKSGQKAFSVFHDMTQERDLKTFFPKYSDVSMRTLTIRDVPFEDEKNIFRVAPLFHLTRIDWSYIWFTQRELNAVKKLQDMGYTYCGTAAQHIPCWLGDRAPVDWLENIVMTDIEGNYSIMPFIRTWKNPQLIGDISNPEYYRGHLEFYKKLIDAGCDQLQRDAAEHHYLAVTTCGGGFTKTGIAGFTKWLKQNLTVEELNNIGIREIDNFNYKEYLIAKGAPVGDDFSRKYKCPIKEYWYKYWDDLTMEFFTRLVKDCKDYADRDIPMSLNNTSFQRWGPLQNIFDAGMSELMMVSANPGHLWERFRACEKLGKFQTIGSAKLLGLEVTHDEKKSLDLKVIATIYANGGLAQVPWDTFEQTKDGSGRFFGEPEDYAPTFGFIRAAADYLDGYERSYDYSTTGILTKTVEADDKPLEVKGTENEVCVFVRSKPGSARSPLAVHLVDWGKAMITPDGKDANEVWELASGEKIYEYVKGMENLKRSKPEPFELNIKRNALNVEPEKLKFKLMTPRVYDRQMHNEAEKSKDYSRLVKTVELPFKADADKVTIQIPRLEFWGILVIEQD
ncbi:hypothetical protein SMSP2_01490 [Limihaloglobus sulfuriphilus]|uniref:Uncharacterized protein n=1 Tax=Limihaloglobus sulfuriphilus TaxID=1851148 RepID=A0A1Q2MEJ6_9BACT|nr:hypothetical protein [Limihaloglobus sulfuriphilus]AQQ71125.1 hypothetical protein SMSP2_01490 [Limihaloglobus sulfuriphilus]